MGSVRRTVLPNRTRPSTITADVQPTSHFRIADLQCELCSTGSKVFTQKRNLLQHLGCKHGKINDVLKQRGLEELPGPELTCFVCGEVQSDQKSMNAHQKLHKLQHCPHCKQYIKRNSKHIDTCKENLNKLLYQCQHCEYSTPKQYNLVRHLEASLAGQTL